MVDLDGYSFKWSMGGFARRAHTLVCTDGILTDVNLNLPLAILQMSETALAVISLGHDTPGNADRFTLIRGFLDFGKLLVNFGGGVSRRVFVRVWICAEISDFL